MKKLKILLIILSLFRVTNFVHASFDITEIMYDTTGTDAKREWIEVENNGNTIDDLSKWYLFSDGSKHSITPQAIATIVPGSYAIIAQDTIKFKADWPGYNGQLFDSSWTSFNNKGESIALKDSNSNIVSPVVFASSEGGAGNGDSLQLIGGVWIGAHPTPGSMNKPSQLKVEVVPTQATTLVVANANTSPSPILIKRKILPAIPITHLDAEVNNNPNKIINLNNLGSSASTPIKNINIPKLSSRIAWIALSIVIMIGMFITWTTKRKILKTMIDTGEISASDIAIVE